MPLPQRHHPLLAQVAHADIGGAEPAGVGAEVVQLLLRLALGSNAQLVAADLALFESLLQPLCVILTVPMALIGVYLIFFYSEASFTREAYVGVIMMFGIVVNNAILLVDHVNGVRARFPELSLSDAIVKGTLERVRPILMTTATTVLGLLPLVLFGEGTGSNIWDALALVLIGGLLSSTLFVLTITPAVYHVLERGKARRMVTGRVDGDALVVPA